MKESAVYEFMFFFLGRDDFLTYADWGPKSKKNQKRHQHISTPLSIKSTSTNREKKEPT